MKKTLALLALLGLLGGCNIFTFRVSVNPKVLEVLRGDPDGSSGVVTLERAKDFTATVICSVRTAAGGSLPSGLSATFTPPTFEGETPNAVLKVKAEESLDPAITTLEAQVYCESGTLYNYDSFTLDIKPKASMVDGRTPDAKRKTQNAKRRTSNAKRKTQDTKRRTQNTLSLPPLARGAGGDKIPPRRRGELGWGVSHHEPQATSYEPFAFGYGYGYGLSTIDYRHFLASCVLRLAFCVRRSTIDHRHFLHLNRR
jgi:hypothetical protein